MQKQIPYEAILKLETGTHSAQINQLLVTPDEKSLITAGNDKTIRIWDVESKKQVSVLLGQIGTAGDGSIQAITLSHDGKFLVALAWMSADASQSAQMRETDLRVYDMVTGNLQANFRYHGELRDLDFSLDGKYLTIVGNPKETKKGLVMIFESKKLLKGFGNFPEPLSTAVLYQSDLIPAYVRFIPEPRGKDGSYRLVAASWEHWRPGAPEYSGRLFWFDLSSKAQLIEKINMEIHDQIAPDSLTVSRQYTIVTAAALSEDKNKKIYCYDQNGKLVNAIDSETLPAQPVFSKDGNQLIVGQREDGAIVQVKVYETAFGQFPLKSSYFGHDSTVMGVGFLAENMVVSAGGDQNAIYFWETTYMEGNKTSEITGVGRVLHVVGITQDEQIGFGYRDDLRLKDGRMVLQRAFDLRTLTLKSFPFLNAENFRRAQKTYGEESLDFSDTFNWNLGILQTGYIFGSPLGWYNVSTYGFTDKGGVVAGSPDGKIRFTPRGGQGYWEMSERLLLGHEASVLDHAASDKWLVTVGADQVIRLWYLADAENSAENLYPALNLFVGSDDEWVIWSKSGYYNASQRGDRRFGYHVNRGSRMEALYFPSDRFIKTFFRPDMIRAILETGSEERAIEKLKGQGITVQPVDVSKILPPIVELTKTSVSKDKKKVTFNFTVEVLNPSQTITRVWIVQNEQFVWQANQKSKKYEVMLSLAPGRNRFKILAETENTKSMPIMQTIFGLESKGKTEAGILKDAGTGRGTKEASMSSSKLTSQEIGNLYILAVGVSEFSDTKSGVDLLRFADDDALSVFNAFSKTDLAKKSNAKSRSETIRTSVKNKAFESVEAVLITNQHAKKADILREINKICSTIEKRAKAKKPKRDVLFVFLSGHGVRLVDETIKDLYYWNYDAVFNDLENTALSFIELGKRITSIPADIILATDACHSGLAGRDLARGLDANELAKFIYAINERGMYIMNAARGDEQAQEHAAIEHGVFTRSILDVLKEDPKAEVSMMKLIDGIQRHVRKWAGDKQTPVIRTYGDLLPLMIFKK